VSTMVVNAACVVGLPGSGVGATSSEVVRGMDVDWMCSC
jgi:hypothetical protein